MTVADLIRDLSAHDPSRLVIVQKDGEGNDYSPLYKIEDANYLEQEANALRERIGVLEEALLEAIPYLCSHMCPSSSHHAACRRARAALERSKP